MRASRLPWMSRRRRVSLLCKSTHIKSSKFGCQNMCLLIIKPEFDFVQQVQQAVSVVIKQGKLKMLSSSPFCCLFQESSRTSRTSWFRTLRRWLALPNCATELKLLPGHSPCLASMTIRQPYNIESGSQDSKVAESWLQSGTLNVSC